MIRMELKEGTSVFTTGGKEVGKINRFVLDPTTNEVTHIVVQKGWLFSEDKVVPFGMVNSATMERVVLSENIDTFDQLPPFEERHYVKAGESEGSDSHDQQSDQDEIRKVDVRREGRLRDDDFPSYYWYPPHGYVGYPIGVYGWPSLETTRNIPGNTISLKEGTDVVSSDGKHVGDIERLFVASDSNKVTHFVISQGLLFKDRKLIPAHWVRTADEGKVDLAVSTQLLKDLPTYE
ncbi:MAG TPA: PRC-barrel domain-containing protein [Anaerolineales bacterium]|nr:PRC-barrel domain-containing protein [Anaerolineales bacterium]